MSLLQRLRRRLDRSTHEPLLPELPPLGWWASWVNSEEFQERALSTPIHDVGHGFDELGLSRDGLAMGLAITKFLYERYFRVEHFGIENVPRQGAAVLACNHSGMLPVDGMMVCADLLRNTDRVARVVMDYFVQNLPIVGTVFTRAGGFGGSRGNFHLLLERGELVLVFPEGTGGVSKLFPQRYQLATWRPGHAELAIRHQAPIVPMCVIGAEEAWPLLSRITGVDIGGIPYIPIPATPLPLPARFRIYYGEPIPIPELYPAEASSDPQAVAEASEQVRHAVEGLIARGLRERHGQVFR